MSRAECANHISDVPAQPRRRRWLLRIGVSLLLFGLLLAVLYSYFAYWTDRELQETIAVIDRDNPNGWQLEDLEAQREAVPDEENAALVVLKVKSLLPPNWPMTQSAAAVTASSQQTWDERHLRPEVQLDEELLRELRTSLAQVEPARAEVRKLIGMTRGRFPLQWTENVFQTKIQSFDARTVATLLRYEAALASQNGNADGAASFVRGLVGTARSIGDEPTILSALVRLACDALAITALERALAQGEPSSRELEAVQALLEKEAAEPLLLRAIRGERAGQHKMLLSLRHGQVSLAQLSGATGPGQKLLNISGPTLARRSHAYMLQLLNEFVKAAQLPPEKQQPVMAKLQQQVRQARMDYDIVTALLMPAIPNVSDANRRGVGNLRCAAVAVALERYRRDHGGWPDRLDMLVPKYLTAVPTDPQDGQPLRFKRRPDGVIVYWVGPDGIDDGGNLNRSNYLAKGSDQGFQLWDVNQRRQPARELLTMPTEEEMP